jgi:FkbM family methyltransferase
MSFDRTEYIKQPPVIESELRTIFGNDDPLIIFEIGACEGEDTIKYARLFPNSTIYTFEPLPQNIALIQKNFAKYGIRNATCFNKALSSENGIAEFYVSSGKPDGIDESDWDYGNKSSSLLPPANHLQVAGFIHFDEKIEVETITLKSFCDNNNISAIDFIHMDVQGAELMVLRGAADFISCIKAIWLEVSKIDLYKGQPLAEDVKQFMNENNFILIKDALFGLQGDQLYISGKLFKKKHILYFKALFTMKHFVSGLLRRIQFFKKR